MRKLYKFFVILPVIFILSCSKKEPDIHYGCLESIKIFQNYSKTFNDLNDCHLTSAQNIGVPPVKSRKEAEELKKTLELIESNELYTVDKLTHSIPYLVPKAKTLLDKIAVNFRDSLASKKGYSHKIIVTSVLRTEDDIKGLRKKNVNSSKDSAHRYGTTFDITYIRFEPANNQDSIPSDRLKTVLAEVLRDLKNEDCCYVKYEIKQGCFHITTR
jgi:hypothetical protein